MIARSLRAPAAVLLVAAAVLPASAKALSPDPSAECIACHGSPGPGSAAVGRSAPAVDAVAFSLSPHRPGGCRSCHHGVDPGGHPAGDPGTRGVGAAATVPCSACHGERQLASKPAHGALLARREPPPCVLCHAPHRMRAVRDWKPRVSVSIYCLTCHQKQLEVSPAGGETLRLTISDAALGASVHLRHDCPDCHAGFSKVEHPLGAGAGSSGGTGRTSGLCPPCHPDQSRLFEGGIHHRLLKIGHPEAPACPDCHGYHAIKSTLELRLLAGTPCRPCHEAVYRAFSESRHAAPQAVGHPQTPLCPSCHRAHDIEYRSFTADLNETCRGCHPEAASRHSEWLPRVELHFGAVACPACHAPAPGGRLKVTIYRTDHGTALGPAQLQAAFGDTYAALLETRETAIPDLAAWAEMVDELNRREGRGKVAFALRIDAPEGAAAHRIGDLADACSSCERCHSGCLELGVRRAFPPGLR